MKDRMKIIVLWLGLIGWVAVQAQLPPRYKKALETGPVVGNGVRATFTDLCYGSHERNRFDIWMPVSKTPVPLVIFIHGGGLTSGGKFLLYGSGLAGDLIKAGIAVAGVDYRYWHQDPRGYLASMEDCAHAVQYLRLNADRYNIDKNRIGCYGDSAGGATSIWLAFHDDMADPGNEDPVLRESTRLACAGALSTPATWDLLQWPAITGIPEPDAKQLQDIALRFGLKEPSEIYTTQGESIRARLNMAGLMSPDDPPFFVFNREPAGVPDADDGARIGHHPNHAKVLKERAEQVGVAAVVSAPGIGLIEPSGETLTAFLIRNLCGATE